MATSISNDRVTYDEEDVIRNRPILCSTTLLVCVLVSYLVFVKVVGPRFMASRKPYSLKYVLLLYNMVMVVLNISFINKFVTVYKGHWFFGMGYFWNYACHPLERSTNPLTLDYLDGMMGFYFSKLLDLLDTVFFVLRKKNSQITFLHLFHHSSMVVAVWLCIHTVRDEIGAVLGCINAIVHVIMYSYYFLAAIGPRVRKYLWWKKYLTQVQIAQFLIIIGVILSLATNDCEVSTAFKYLWSTLILLNLGLFINFYRKTYIRKSD